MHAVRVAAKVRRELNVQAQIVGGPYGQFQVLLDGALVLDGGPLAALGILPSSRKVIDALRDRMSSNP